MSTCFYNPFLAKFIENMKLMLRETKVWLWFMEDMKAEHVHEIMRRHMEPNYVVSRLHYVVVPTQEDTRP